MATFVLIDGAAGSRRQLVVADHSSGGFTTPLVADRLPVTDGRSAVYEEPASP